MSYSVSWSAAVFDERTGKRPPGRFANACTRYGSSAVIIHGGCSWLKRRKFKILEDMWIMKISMPGHIQWEALSQRGHAPGPRINHHLCYVAKMLYLFGGKKSQEDKRAVPGMFLYDYVAQCWYLQHVESEGGPYCLGNTASVIDDQIFTFGGMHDGKVTAKTHLFDPQMSTWSNLQTSGAVPPARCDHGACTVRSSLFIHGGCAGPDLYLSDLYELDTNTLLWTRLEFGGVNNIPRAGHTLTAHHGKDLYVFGGHNDLIYPDGGPVMEEMTKYSLGQKRWKTPKAFPSEFDPALTYDHSAVIIQGCLYIIGGLALDGMANDVQVARLISPSDRKMPREDTRSRGLDTPDLSSSGIYDAPPEAIREDIYVEPHVHVQRTDSGRHVRFTASPKTAVPKEQDIESVSSLTSLGIASPPTTAPPPRPASPQPKSPPVPELREVPVQLEHAADVRSQGSESERERLRSPPPPVSSLDDLDYGRKSQENGERLGSPSTALQNLSSLTTQRSPPEDSSTTSDNDNISTSSSSSSSSNGDHEKQQNEGDKKENETKTEEKVSSSEKEAQGGDETARIEEDDDDYEFTTFAYSRRPDTAIPPADDRAWYVNENEEVEVPVETDNGNDEEDTDSDERTLTVAERQQLEQLSAQMSLK